MLLIKIRNAWQRFRRSWYTRTLKVNCGPDNDYKIIIRRNFPKEFTHYEQIRFIIEHEEVWDRLWEEGFIEKWVLELDKKVTDVDHNLKQQRNIETN